MFAFIFSILFLLTSYVLSSAKHHANSHTSTRQPKVPSQESNSINIVLFFAESDANFLNFEKTKGIASLKLSRVGQVKPCTYKPESNVPQNFKTIIRSTQNKECDCTKLLESGILSLLGWAHNTVGMSTAMISLQTATAEERNNGRNFNGYKTEDDESIPAAPTRQPPPHQPPHQPPPPYPPPPAPHPPLSPSQPPKSQHSLLFESPQESPQQPLHFPEPAHAPAYLAEQPAHVPAHLLEQPAHVPPHSLQEQLQKPLPPTNKQIYHKEHVKEEPPLPIVYNDMNPQQMPLLYENTKIQPNNLPKFQCQNLPPGSIITINAFPYDPRMRFPNMNRYHRKFRPEDLINVHRVKRQFIVEPEHTQVFEIGGKMNENPGKIVQESPDMAQRPGSIWDLLGVMSTIRESFFVNFINPMLDPKQRMSDEENGIDFKALGQVQEPSLFEIVKKMLQQLQQQSGEPGNSGFILIIFGGRLSELTNPYSHLSQCIKHVLETTDVKRTLTVVTGNCPKYPMINASSPETAVPIVPRWALHHKKNNKKKQKQSEKPPVINLLPIYAKGPHSEMLSKCQELVDVPKKLQEIINEHSSKQVNIGRASTRSNSKIQSSQNPLPIQSPNSMQNQNQYQDFNKNSNVNLNVQNAPTGLWISREIQNSIFGRSRKDVRKDIRRSHGVQLLLSRYILVVLVLVISGL